MYVFKTSLVPWIWSTAINILGGNAEKLSAREQVWHRLAQVLHALPLRNRFVMAGDFNMALVPRAPWIGPAVQAPPSGHEPDILPVKHLCIKMLVSPSYACPNGSSGKNSRHNVAVACTLSSVDGG